MADRDRVLHLLRRTEYVVKPARLRALTRPSVSLAEAVDDILDFSLNPSDVTNFDPEAWQSRDEQMRWWVRRMATAPRPFQEKMTFFWHGHFVSSWEKVSDYQAMVDQNRLFRRFAVGNLRTLTQRMAVQPAMLFYLDNVENSKDSPNQNFARELMELFTLGIVNPDTGRPNYSEADVEAAAAAWTGHGIDWETLRYEFHEWDHDTSRKTFFGTTKSWDGPEIIDHILRDHPGKRRVAARFITRKIWEYLAAPLPPGPHPPFIRELADVLIASDMQIRPMLRAMLLRPEFYSRASREGLVRTPVDFAVALFHHSRVPLEQWLESWSMQGTGQVPFWPPNVSGWRPNGYWINTTAIATRAQLVRYVADRMVGWDNEADANKPLHQWLLEATPLQAYDRMAKVFYRDPATEVSAETRQAILAYYRRATELDDWIRPYYLIGMLVMAPEFHLA